MKNNRKQGLPLLADELIARGYKLHYGVDSEQTVDAGAELPLTKEKARLQSELNLDEFQNVLDTIKEPIFIHDEAFRLIKVNRAYTQYADLPPEEIIGRRYWEVFPLQDGPLPGCAKCVAKAGGPPAELPITLDDGLTFYSKGFAVTDQHDGYRFSVHVLEDITKLKVARESSVISDDILRAITFAAHDAIIVIGNDGKVLFWNTAAGQMFGYQQDEAIGQDLHTMIAPERLHKNLVEGFAAFKKTGQGPVINTNLELQGLRKDGVEFPIELSVSSFQLKGLWHAVGIVRDISDRKNSEDALRSSEKRLRDLIENEADGVLVLDMDSTIKFVNRAAEVMFGRASQEMLGKPFGYPVTVDKPAEMNILRPDAGSLVAEMRVGETEWENEPAYVVSLRDITERRQAEEQIKSSEEKFRTIFESSNDAIILLDDVSFFDCNKATLKIFGCKTREEFLVRHPGEWSPPRQLDGQSSRESSNEKIASAYREGRSFFEWTHIRANNEAFPAEVLLTPLRLGEKTLLQATVRDITERKRAEASLKRSNKALRTLSATNESLIHATDEQQLLNDICNIIVNIGDYLMAWVGYVEGDDRPHVVPIAKGGHVEDYLEAMPDVCFAPAEQSKACCPSVLSIYTEKTAVANDTQTNPQHADWNKLAKQFGFGSTIALPLDFGTRGRGVLNIYATESNAFYDEEIALLTELAEDLAFGVQTLRMRTEHEQSSEKLQNALVQAIQAVANTVEQRDPYTAGHQRRVAELAVAIATDIGLEEERIKGVLMGATIHDIGKIYIPADILNRPGKLDDFEFGIIKTHPAVGYDIIKGVEFPWPVAQMIRQHHERIDGSGYPDGLKGDAILLEARILAVADVVEAIASHRPYRPAFGIDAALEEIQKNRGHFYDAVVVDSCIKLFGSKRFSWQE